MVTNVADEPIKSWWGSWLTGPSAGQLPQVDS